MLVLEEPGIARQEGELASLQTQLERERGVEAVIGPADQPLPSRAGVMLAPGGARRAASFSPSPLRRLR
jgi:hypothetical protein